MGDFMDTRQIVFGGFLALISWLFQLLPVVFSEIFVFITILSSIPVYIGSRIGRKIGVMVYIVAGFLVSVLSVHEGLFFFFTNGIVGLSLGIARYYTTKKLYIGLISGAFLTISLSIMIYLFDILVFGTDIPGSIPVQLAILFGFSFIYCSMFNILSDFIYKRVIEKL